MELMYELLLERDGRELLFAPAANYVDCDYEAALTMLRHPHTVVGLGDGGAHCGSICDGSYPTYLLTHWGRDRTRGERLPLEFAVRRYTRAPAELIGLYDRGLIAPGMKADINLIDHANLYLSPPTIVHDLPGRWPPPDADGQGLRRHRRLRGSRHRPRSAHRRAAWPLASRRTRASRGLG